MFTESIDVAQVVLYVFWIFFFGLIFWLRREDRREGYPLETDNPRRIWPSTTVLIPMAKTFILPHGGESKAPNFVRDERPMQAERTAPATGAPWEPIGDPLLSGVGPASWANRKDEVDTTHAGLDLIVPLRKAHEYAISAGSDPRGWNVVAADGKVAGVIKDLWIDRADVMVRYLEVQLGGGPDDTRLIPVPMLRILAADGRNKSRVEVVSIKAGQFASVPRIKNPERITTLEEERISAFYAGGRLYADPERQESIL